MMRFCGRRLPMSHDPLAGLLRSFNLTTMASIYADTLQQAEQHHWGYRKFLQHLCESEAEDRRQRRVARLLKHSGLPDGKSLGNREAALMPDKIRRQLPTLLEGGFVERGENVLAFGLPGRGKSHFVAALGRELILRHGHTVLFIPTFKLVQKLLLAKKALKLEALLRKLDRYRAQPGSLCQNAENGLHGLRWTYRVSHQLLWRTDSLPALAGRHCPKKAAILKMACLACDGHIVFPAHAVGQK